MLSIITLPDNLMSDVASTTSVLISDLSPVITLVLGVLLTVIVLSIIIGALKR